MPLPSVRYLLLFTVLLMGAMPSAGFAADPQPYEVKLAPTGNTALDKALHDTSSLISLQKNAPVGGFALTERARQDLDRFTTALHSYGYYNARIVLTIDGRSLDDPDLATAIDQAPAKPPSPVQVRFDLGPQFHIGRVVIRGAVPADVRAKLGLEPGQPALAADVLAARERLLAAIRDDGYPLAKLDMPPATLRPADDSLDVLFIATTGPQAEFGDIAITGLKNMHESYVRRRLLLHPGERFSPAAIEKARQDLASIGVFSVVRIEPANQLDAHGRLPLTINVTERPLHAVDAGVGYSTDLGVNFNLGWHDRNLFGNAEQLNLTAMMQLGGDAVNRPGYLFGAQFIKPDFLTRDQALEIDLGAVDQSLKAYDQNALTQKIAVDRKLSPLWTASAGVSGEQEEITQEGERQHYNLVGLPLTLKFDNSNNLLDPTKGIRALFSVTPTEALGSRNTGFVILQAAGSTYLDFSGTGRSVLALRGLVGEVPGVGTFGLPPDQRFYAGGSATVRGYRYQSVGPAFADRNPTGGTAVSTATVEFRQRILGNYGAVAFVDAGQVSANGVPFTDSWRIGAGIGVRYYTSIGPIRLDVAVPLNREPGGDSFELYIGIGQAF
jgi:translocation and assembly module TamA